MARVVVDALQYGEQARRLYDLYAWSVLPTHVHLILQPYAPLPEITRWLKGCTARRGNRILGLTGTTFWQDESFDHWVRNRDELQELIHYVEENPVNAGLVGSVEKWPWSSAGAWADGKKRPSAPLCSV